MAELAHIDADIKDVIGDVLTSTSMCAKILCPDRFTVPFSSYHDDLFELLDNPKYKRVAIAAPRGIGKSSIANFAFVIRNILSKMFGVGGKNLIVPISHSGKNAMIFSEDVKRELMTNSMIKKLFGDVKTNDFSKELWVTTGGTMVFPRGQQQQVRGIRFGASRPDLIVLDDVEDKEEVQSDEIRAKTWEWFRSDVCNSVNRHNDDAKIVVIGTILHEDSLLQRLIDNPSWESIVLDLCSEPPELKSKWPEFLSDQQVLELYNDHEREGDLDLFYQEFLNKAQSPESGGFPTHIESYDEVEVAGNSEIESIVLYDPSKTVTATSSFAGIVGVGFHPGFRCIYVRDVVMKRLHPDEQYNEVFNMVKRLGANIVGVEVTSLNDHVVYPMKAEAAARGLAGRIQFIELHAKKDKNTRIKGLVPLYRNGRIKHNKSATTYSDGVAPSLEAQIKAWPRGKYKDALDALANIVPMLEKGERYFLPNVSNWVSEDKKKRDWRELRRLSRPPLEFRRI